MNKLGLSGYPGFILHGGFVGTHFITETKNKERIPYTNDDYSLN